MDTTPHRKRLLTVEIHDVTPAHHDAILHLRTALRRAGVRRPTLLVVPRYRAESGLRWDLRDAPQTLEWLHAEVSAGAEIVQHGLTHRAPRPPPRSLRAGLMHRHFSRGCAEFAFLTYAEARERLLVGRRVLAACGLESHGFIAPAWQQSPGAQRAIRDLGFRFTATFGGVRALVEPGPGLVGSLALTFDAAGRTIDYGKRLVMRGFERINRHAPIVRLALHPSDAEAPGRLPYILRRLSVLMKTRDLTTYERWLGPSGRLGGPEGRCVVPSARASEETPTGTSATAQTYS